jgi:hypothetical protein
MKNFSKSLLAVALLAAGTGAANASIAPTTTALGGGEAFLEVYDSVQKTTFNLDLGITEATLAASVADATFFQSWDLAALTASAANSKWSTFAAGGLTSAVYTVAAGTAGQIMFTSNSAAGTTTKFATITAAGAAITNTNNQISKINVGISAQNPTELGLVSENLSSIAVDGGAVTGYYGTAATLWGGLSLANASIAYGATGNFLYDVGATATKQFATQFLLSNGVLTLGTAPVSSVPLPAAVWMFGAGLMGVLRLNRRKSIAA